MSWLTVSEINGFRIEDGAGQSWFGGDQQWFPRGFHKEAACGATTCANIMGYLARTRTEYAELAAFDLSLRSGFLSFMQQVYPCVRPGLIGIMPAYFTRGVREYALSRGYRDETEILTIPGARNRRPTPGKVGRFIAASLEEDRPVAFLNLSNGRVKNLDSYHWVTIAALDESALLITIIDNGRKLEVDMGKWLKKTAMGGALVQIRLFPAGLPESSESPQ